MDTHTTSLLEQSVRTLSIYLLCTVASQLFSRETPWNAGAATLSPAPMTEGMDETVHCHSPISSSHYHPSRELTAFCMAWHLYSLQIPLHLTHTPSLEGREPRRLPLSWPKMDISVHAVQQPAAAFCARLQAVILGNPSSNAHL